MNHATIAWFSLHNKTPGSPPGVFIWGQPSAAGVTPHCAGAASPRRSHSEPGSPSPPTASMKSSGAALFTACGPAMSCPARHFLPGACPLPHSATGYFHPRKKTPHEGGHSQVQKVDYGQPERQQRGSEILSGPLVLLSF